jgi:hypothetical protein
MRFPVGDGWNPYLHEMEGMLRISYINTCMTMMKIWVLLDYDKEVWSLKYHIKLPKVGRLSDDSFRDYTAVSEKGDMLFFWFYPPHMFHLDNKSKRLEKFEWKSCYPHNTKHRFKESLISHAFFPTRGCHPGEEPYFMQGLGTVLIQNNLFSYLCMFYSTDRSNLYL